MKRRRNRFSPDGNTGFNGSALWGEECWEERNIIIGHSDSQRGNHNGATPTSDDAAGTIAHIFLTHTTQFKIMLLSRSV